MQRKIPVRSILFLSLIQIGLLLLLLAWWGPFYQFLLPAAVLGQADWGTGAWLAAELLLILFVMNRFFEGAVCREPGGSQTLFQRAKIWLYATILCTIGSLGQIVGSFRELGVEHLPAEVRLRFILAAGLPLVLFWAGVIWVGWRWGERLRAAEETADADEQRSLADRRMRFALSGVGRYALLTAVWLLLFAAAWWVRTRFFS